MNGLFLSNGGIMFYSLKSYEPVGFSGEIVSVEVDIRRGIPGIDIVGLPDNAVREAKERVRVAIRNSGYKFPPNRILINLAPADLKKEGASYDLPIAMAILFAAGEMKRIVSDDIMVLGELNLTGSIKPVRGVLGAVIAGRKGGIKYFVVPPYNFREALSLRYGNIFPLKNLRELKKLFGGSIRESVWIKGDKFFANGESESSNTMYSKERLEGDFTDVHGHAVLKRALEIAAAGFHNILIVGPPGSGKTLSVSRLPTILPKLNREESLEVTKLHSIAGLLPSDSGVISCRPFRVPHHSASIEGIMGGGRIPKPGEVSLAHRGVLFLDEAFEFKKSVLQGLREPVESGNINLSRVGRKIQFPADFQLVMTANPCPCGNLGKENAICVCSVTEIHRYWKKMGEALLDRIDIRVPVRYVGINKILRDSGESSSAIAARVLRAVEIQENRYRNLPFNRNSRIPPSLINDICGLNHGLEVFLTEAIKKLALSSRAHHSILKVARTIADLAENKDIREEHLLEAIHHRQFGSTGFIRFFN